ncbi:5-(carboxyamino)imidazole ribonucleotide synthase [Dellaglioa algida]|uniref:5-(carboxyamino)imidazole ribonucleotide synthase n=1 Tax=Dellaglioa algida TaxID=105612 RepID=UPI000BDC8342|nr:5-(carboxyamino)imidazole ribonucleotide synthase [Dellaglioa algida]MDK1718005.1 5-(carboxyamino)imidazole ribonucleotide synthase [Dellaglioa algida]MDK1729226.1 5-(carboxyamino)imidazole ribonucleotide synthase [Dellaglioa algida]MDK1741660.1 5-(carboxyamino)imidazole ribonucleotide synthase [Dellaglioa algida]SOB49582.1 N5-carboxyaminoimidazole ribonucleotide synthase [Dellaglioa algida]
MIYLTKKILPGQIIGIIGGGQLGKMMTTSAKEMGYRVIILDPEEDCPAAQVADEQVIASYDDESAIINLAKMCDVLTFEFENVNADTIDMAKHYCYIPQGSTALRISQDRISEKRFLAARNFPIAPFKVILNSVELQDAIKMMGYPAILKTVRGGYDGKGQVILKNAQNLTEAINLLQNGECVLEGFVQFNREVSVIIARNELGQQSIFPIIENRHRNNILHESFCPSLLSVEMATKIEMIASKIADDCLSVGTMGIEFFISDSGGIYVNEIAPRPHNSGHLTMEACSLSQFEAHIRGICNLPMPNPQLLSGAIMINILGQHTSKVLNEIKNKAQWHFHFYGKEEVKKNRKMGHITVLTNNLEKATTDIYQTKIWD